MITAAAQGAGRAQEQMTSFYRDDLSGLPEMSVVARQLWRRAGLRPSEIDVGILYDHFTPFVLMQLEEFGFCGPGEAADFVAAQAAAAEYTRRAARGGVSARDERHSGGGTTGARHVGEPDTGAARTSWSRRARACPHRG